MSIDRRSNGVNDLPSNIRLLSEVPDGLLVLISQFNDLFITKPSDIVGFNNSSENGEAMLNIREVVESIDVNTSNFNLVTWSGLVNKIME